ncbi:MAG TPA: hypothetical protein VMW75_06670, partial [Thermoanaerobaculia bacterium]|nr:hypothetical protein [Thermoanaerobaculia bacterium]
MHAKTRPKTKQSRVTRGRSSRAALAASTTVACWEDDPGDPALQPALQPITAPAPDPSAGPLPFAIGGVVPPPQVYGPGTTEFLFYAAACALRRTADFWGAIVPAG